VLQLQRQQLQRQQLQKPVEGLSVFPVEGSEMR